MEGINKTITNFLKYIKYNNNLSYPDPSVDLELKKYMSDQPTQTDYYGNKYWKNKEGKYHRLDGPAIEYINGHKEWCQNGKLHRLDGSAIEWFNGTKSWCQNGQRHRLDGPAVEWANGDKEWYQNGTLHRLDGPTKEFADGTKEWYYVNQYINNLVGILSK